MEESTKEVTVNAYEMLANATGPLEYGLTNDYLFNIMLNEKTHRVFSDKLKISVLNLRKVEYATKDDSDYMIDYWAKVFKAKSWEELKMLAEKSEVMQEGIVTLRELTADEEVRMQMWAREDHNRIIRTYEHRIEGLETEVAQKDAELEQKDAEIERLKALLEQAQMRSH